MKTIYYTATSLDGFIATEDDSLEWLFPLGDVNDTSYPRFIDTVGALAMGTATYEWMTRHALEVKDQMGSAWPYSQPSWVFTHRELPRIEGADIRFTQGPVHGVHAEMVKAACGKNVWVVGGGDLAGQFSDAGLLDEAIIQLASVTLGRGKPLFPRRVTSPPWQLISVRQVGSGFAELHYKLPARSSGAA
jgi:dihydrofolate reductase